MSPAGNGGALHFVFYCSAVLCCKAAWPLPVQSPVGEDLGCLQDLTSTSKGTRNVCVQVLCVNTGFCFSWVGIEECDWVVYVCMFQLIPLGCSALHKQHWFIALI